MAQKVTRPVCPRTVAGRGSVSHSDGLSSVSRGARGRRVVAGAHYAQAPYRRRRHSRDHRRPTVKHTARTKTGKTYDEFAVNRQNVRRVRSEYALDATPRRFYDAVAGRAPQRAEELRARAVVGRVVAAGCFSPSR